MSVKPNLLCYLPQVRSCSKDRGLLRIQATPTKVIKVLDKLRHETKVPDGVHPEVPVVDIDAATNLGVLSDQNPSQNDGD